MKIYILFVTIFFLVSGCDTSRNYIKDEKAKKFHIDEYTNYQIIDTLNISIDEITDPLLYPYFQFKIIDSIPYIIFFKSNNEIEFVSIENNEDRVNVPFSSEGPNAVAGTESFYVHNLDSIFFLSANELKRISLHNGNGEVLDKWDLNKSKEEEWMGETMFFDFKYNSKFKEIYYWTYSGKIKKRLTRETFKIKAFNIVDENIREVGFIPDQYKKINYHPFYQIGSFVSENNDLMLNFFPPINRVYKSDLSSDSANIEITEFSSKDFQHPTEPFMDKKEVDAEIEEESSYLIESNFIYKVVSNKAEDLYYLFYRKGLPYLKSDGSKRTMYEYDFDILLLNKNMEPQGIIKVDKPYNHFSHASFAFENKLYVSINNPINPGFNEDFVRFVVYGEK